MVKVARHNYTILQLLEQPNNKRKIREAVLQREKDEDLLERLKKLKKKRSRKKRQEKSELLDNDVKQLEEDLGAELKDEHKGFLHGLIGNAINNSPCQPSPVRRNVNLAFSSS